jgi:hypothetical protein
VKRAPLALALAVAAAAGSAHARPELDLRAVSTTTAVPRITQPITTLPILYIPWAVTWKCRFADGRSCSRADLANPAYKQLVILPAGFTDGERADFWTEFDRVISGMTGPNAGNSWSRQQAGKLLFVGYFTAGGALNQPGAEFDAAVAAHPIRDRALSSSSAKVHARIAQIRTSTLPELRPMAVGLVFNTFDTGITANAAPPNFLSNPWGIARFTRRQLDSSYITVHEFGHAAMSFLDEYVEGGFAELDIRQLDVLTPVAIFDGSWGSLVDAIGDLLDVYDVNFSEVLANNGNANIALSRWPSTVDSSGYAEPYFEYEGGMFFGRGTFHVNGANLMDGGNVARGPGDVFGYDHSRVQQETVDAAFSGVARRPNDRLRAAGPTDGWPLELGGTTTVMIFDGDKLNHFHPTQFYDVQVGWYERQWKTCWWGPLPYACYDDVWRTAMKRVWPSPRSIDLRASAIYGAANLLQTVACGLGFTEIPISGDKKFKLCEQSLDTVATAFLPTFDFPMPYQNTTVPASQWFTTYWWRFASHNGTRGSGWTGWSSFYRSL